MPGTMSEADLVADLRASLQDAASVFTAAADADIKRHLAVAALALGEKRPRTLVGTLALIADQADYTAPALFLTFKFSLWGIAPRAAAKPWDPGYPGRLPNVRMVETAANPVTRKLTLDPSPTSGQITVLGAEFKFYYQAGHSINAAADQTTVAAGDRGLLILRAQAEAMREMAMRNIQKPVVVREGYSSQPRNGTPTALYEAFLKEWQVAA